MNQKLIKQFREGEIAAHYRQGIDSVDQLRRLMKKAVPKYYVVPFGDQIYYYINEWFWYGSNETFLPTVPVAKFFEEECNGNCGMNYCDTNGCVERKRELTEPKEPEWQPKNGEMVEVSDDGDNWEEATYIGMHWMMVVVWDDNKKHYTSKYYCRPLPQSITIEEAERLLKEKGIEVTIKNS